MLFSIPAAVVIHYEGTHSGIPDIENFPFRILSLWFTSFSFWFADRLLCDLWLWLGNSFPIILMLYCFFLSDTLQLFGISRIKVDQSFLSPTFHFEKEDVNLEILTHLYSDLKHSLKNDQPSAQLN
ncbi:hypothetical protein DICVIV_07035 [Dictyocaulus viviparus]|uniref:Uncharacterized protein n=1 Tax=Dictyocaulus viviparus TaxID=29172 RepID=A0A0D8XQF8_DICVI|nr:hypothetical protein DICVIV_07035 [Dictyocaulus viviparus]